MLLTTCACCAAPLPTFGAGAKKCSRCKTRYCGQACQQQHWKEGGHDKLCKKIKRGGGAEAYHAEEKYKEAAAEAVSACAHETKDQTCYMCTAGAEKEGLVRGCGCRGDSGIAHLSCLVQQAKILQENDVGVQGTHEWWRKCKVCGQWFEGAVARALTWACWKHALVASYPEKYEQNIHQIMGMHLLSCTLRNEGCHSESIAVTRAKLDFLQGSSHAAPGSSFEIEAKEHIVLNLYDLERYEEALPLIRECYAAELARDADSDVSRRTALVYCRTLVRLKRVNQARVLYRKHITRQTDDIDVERAQVDYFAALLSEGVISQPELREAKRIMEERCKRARQAHGSDGPETREAKRGLAAFLRDAKGAFDSPADAESALSLLAELDSAVDADRHIRQGMSVLNLDGAPVLNLDDWRAVPDGEGGTIYLPPKSNI